ncbi:DUF6944 family repetitive protein [Texcoconibacillus texcoconensis]|uniref:Uncharacterized protein n=1 Tax=Texcoconibacillus texcoconensis TaxID=1095777 RepID=A0A840QSB9_9BACI|nr:hypothetical protein [Texcoconibacillus texcoconensis]MBB5174191.1 hypothetical protein [Texcoconibacillus texcoconensis]
MNDDELVIYGSWFEAIGQVISAIGATARVSTEDGETDLKLIAIGEVMQSIGNALIAIGTDDTTEEFGHWIEVGGAATSAVGAAKEINGEESEGVRLEMIGDGFQAVGSHIQGTAVDDERLVVAHDIQTTGALLESVGLSVKLQGKRKVGELLNAIGSWIQASGGWMQATVLTENHSGSNDER